jgi:peptidoglycan hydrolase-like protein with peptidoglycan-binding domain
MSCYVEKVLEISKAEVGYLEKASNMNLDSKTANAGKMNYTKYARDLDNISGFYNGKKQGFAWCDCFVDWCMVKAYGVENAKRLLCQPSKSLGAGCKYSMNYYKSKGQLKSSPKIGDQIFFKNKSGEVCHTGLVYDVDKSYVYTIEGNTSTASGVVANGGGVCMKKYKLNYKLIAGFGRPNYDIKKTTVTQKTDMPKLPIIEWQKAAVADGFKMSIDGVWGPECNQIAKQAIVKKRLVYKHKNLTKIVQRAVGVKDDGKCGSATSDAIKKYQAKNGLMADGEVGLNTWKKILGVN